MANDSGPRTSGGGAEDRRITAVLDASGRLVVPASLRKALGFRRRQRVVLTREGRALRIERVEDTVDAAVREAQELARRHGGGRGGQVDAFLAERRQEAHREGRAVAGCS